MAKGGTCPATGQAHQWRAIGVRTKKGHTVELRICVNCKAKIGVRV